MKQFKFRYPSVIDSEGRMYADIKNVLSRLDIDKMRLFEILLAVSEAFTNALIHGNQCRPDKSVEVDVSINDELVIADIIDEGEGFEVKPAMERQTDYSAESGRGIDLMRTIADRVVFGRNNQTGGTQISMQFRRGKSADSQRLIGNMEDKMEIKCKDEGNITVISLSGRMDLDNGSKLKEEIKKVLASGKTSVHLNLRAVEFVNSSGLGALVSIMKEVRIHRGRMTLSDMADHVREVFDITQLSHIFEIFPTEQEALHSYKLITAN